MIMAIHNRFTALAGAVTLACSAWAQQPPEQNYADQQAGPDQYSAGQFQDASDQASQNQVDPPSRVARMANLSGEVSFSPAGENEWSRAQRNRPMATGDKLYTTSGRAELQIGTSSILVDERSNMDFLTLNDQMTQVELTQGSLSIDVRNLRGGEVYEIDTPTIAFIADRVGSYRIDVDPNGQVTTVSVRRGGGDAVGEGGKRVHLDQGQRLVFNDSQLSNYQTADLRSGDSFDTYVTERVTRYEHAPARRYVSEEVVGYEDLDDNGTWEDAPEYGHVWYPSGVATDWAPYHDGTWDWVEPWGWTWVDNASWGFAPFHYGRWAYVGSRWGWVPGPVDVAPVYAPALVAFVGGGGFGVDISVGGPIGWFALGPRDVYFPGYRCGRDYFGRVNMSNTIVNTTVVNNYYGAFSSGRVNYAQMNYANRMAPRAVTAVPTAAFASGRPVAASAIAVNRTMLTNARVLPRATVVPTAASLVANRARATAPPAAVMNRNVVAANRPAPAAAPFAQRQALLRQHPGQPVSTTQMRTLAAQSNARNPAAMRNNVRVAGAAGASTSAANARASARATAAAPGVSVNRSAAQTAANTRSAPNANAQLRSSGFAHGNVPRESATAQQHASPNARFERGTSRPVNPPRESATAQAHASANARFERGTSQPTQAPRASAATQNRSNAQLRSSGFAHGNAPREQAGVQHRTTANARMEQQRGNAPVRSSTFATQNRNAEQQHSQARVQAQSRVNEQRAQAQSHASERVTQPQVREQPRVQAQSRAPEHVMQPQVREQPRVQAQSRAPERVTQPQVREQPRVQAQSRAPERVAQPQMREAPRAQAQYREPQRPTTQREQRAPQQQAKRKDDKRDQNGGG
jgi:hypothetical protein